IAAMRENFQHLDPLAQIVSELQTVSGLAPITDDLQAVSEVAHSTDELQAVSELAPYVQALLDSRIVEMGSNSNGEYVRWENGLQVCWRREIVGAVQDFTSTFNVLDDRPFPAVFVELTGVQATVGVASDQPSTRGAFYIASAGAELNKWDRLCIVRHANASGGTQTVYVNLL